MTDLFALMIDAMCDWLKTLSRVDVADKPVAKKFVSRLRARVDSAKDFYISLQKMHKAGHHEGDLIPIILQESISFLNDSSDMLDEVKNTMETSSLSEFETLLGTLVSLQGKANYLQTTLSEYIITKGEETSHER